MENKMTFEQKMERLNEIVNKLNNQEVNLDNSLSLYEEAQTLIKELKDEIAAAKEKVDKYN